MTALTRAAFAVTALTVAVAVMPLVARGAPPKVVISSPDNGEVDVDPAVSEIRVEFDQPMAPGGRSIVGGGESFPKFSGPPRWVGPKTIVIPLTLEPSHEYHLGINSDTFRNFTAKTGQQPAEWYPIMFRTRAAGAAAAAPDVTPQQNREAVAALVKAIDGNYAYRDRRKVDWPKEIAKRRAALESAKSANEFARLTAHLLRAAEDAHVSVAAGDVRIGTRVNSVPPNFNVATLKGAVPNWTEHPGGVVSGRFEAETGGGIGYILFSECSKEQADSFDAVLDDLKGTKALALDARFNGGGDELAARQVAGRFVEKATTYSKNRLREGGRWTGPFDRAVKPRADAPGERYAKPVAVLIGPKVGSSAESFVLMMKHGAGAKLIGGVTKGSSGRPKPHDLGNGVTAYLSSWEDQLPDGTLLEGRGVRPDTMIATELADFDKSDPVLEAALKYLRGRSR